MDNIAFGKQVKLIKNLNVFIILLITGHFLADISPFGLKGSSAKAVIPGKGNKSYLK